MSMPLNTRIRLSLMMFLQFMMIAVWWVPLAQYLGGTLGLTGNQRALIMSTMAFGCLIAPIIGMIADRHFASQKVLAVLNLLGAGLLFVAAQQTNPTMVFLLLLLEMLCYMPTWGLTSAIAMTHSPAESFPQIRVFGSIGWVAAAVFSLVARYTFGTDIDGTAIPLYCAAGVSALAALTALTLPNTPPPAKGQKASIIDVLGLRAAGLMKDFGFLVFIVISTAVMIPFSIYWSYCSVFLADEGFGLITATMNAGQFVEMFIMILVPVVLAKIGLKWAMTAGLVALLIRYLSFLAGGMYDQTWLYFVAILIHGVIYGFFFTGGQIYVDKKAPAAIRAQAQGFLFLITFGVGLLAGNFINEHLIGKNSTSTVAVAEDFKLPTIPKLVADKPAIEGAKFSDAKVYGRALNASELQILAAGDNETLIKNLKEEAKANGVKVDLDAGVLDLLGAVTAKDKTLTVTAKLELPVDDKDSKDDDVLDGSLLSLGEGDNKIELAVEKGKLVLAAGEKKIVANTVALPRNTEVDGKVKSNPIYIAATFDGKNISLATNGSTYQIRDWGPIWTVTVITCAVLLVLFVILFHFKEAKEQAPADDAPAEEAPGEEAPAEEAPAEETPAADAAEGETAE